MFTGPTLAALVVTAALEGKQRPGGDPLSLFCSRSPEDHPFQEDRRFLNACPRQEAPPTPDCVSPHEKSS
jgi:hypothetical protein